MGAEPRIDPAELSIAEWSELLARVIADPTLVVPHAQPIVDLKRGVVAGYELLARFDHPLGGSPAEWFATASALGCVHELDAAILNAGRGLLGRLPANTFLSVNLTSEGAISGAVLDAASRGPRLDSLVVELTEQGEIEDIELLASAAARLRERGAMVAIDDAGAGYAGLQRILAVRPEFIKVDRSLVSAVDVDAARAATIEMLGSLGDRIDAWIVAEGVERRAELERIIQIGVPLAQGFFFARPSASFEEPDASWVRNELKTAGRPADCIAPLVEIVHPALTAAGADEIGWRFDDDHGLDYLPVVDENDRPAAIVDRESRVPLETIRAAPTTQVVDVLRRAITRDLHARLLPILCCDEGGRYLGLVRVERMIERVCGPAGGATGRGDRAPA